MQRSDKAKFTTAFELVARALQKRFTNTADRRDTEKAYFLALEDLPIEAVEAAAVLICKEGTSDGWFPRAPEWADVALRLHVTWQLEALGRQRALPPVSETIDAELVVMRLARDRFVADCRAHGRDGLAAVYENRQVNHPSTDTDAPYCPQCADSGWKEFGRDVGPCECLNTNPVLLALRLKAVQNKRPWTRRKRAAALTPSRAETLLSP